MASNNKSKQQQPAQIKKPIPPYVIDRVRGFGAAVQSILQQQEQFLADAAGLWGINQTVHRVWWNFVDTATGQPLEKPTYEVLTVADWERRQRLQSAIQQAGGAASVASAPAAKPKADPQPRDGEKVLQPPKAASGGTGGP